MMPAGFILTSVARTLVEVAGLALVGQGALALLAGAGRERNVIYQGFRVVTRPVVQAVRRLTPRVVPDRHLPLLTLFLLFWLWLALAILKGYLCALHGLDCRG